MTNTEQASKYTKTERNYKFRQFSVQNHKSNYNQNRTGKTQNKEISNFFIIK